MAKHSKKIFDFHPRKNLGIIERFRQVRKENNLLQAEFSEMLGESLSLIKAIEAGRVMPSIEIIRKVHKRFRKSYEYLLDGK